MIVRVLNGKAVGQTFSFGEASNSRSKTSPKWSSICQRLVQQREPGAHSFFMAKVQIVVHIQGFDSEVISRTISFDRNDSRHFVIRVSRRRLFWRFTRWCWDWPLGASSSVPLESDPPTGAPPAQVHLTNHKVEMTGGERLGSMKLFSPNRTLIPAISRGVLLLTLAVALTGCELLGFPEWQWRQKLAVEVELPSGSVSGASVMAVKCGSSPKWLRGKA